METSRRSRKQARHPCRTLPFHTLGSVGTCIVGLPLSFPPPRRTLTRPRQVESTERPACSCLAAPTHQHSRQSVSHSSPARPHCGDNVRARHCSLWAAGGQRRRPGGQRRVLLLLQYIAMGWKHPFVLHRQCLHYMAALCTPSETETETAVERRESGMLGLYFFGRDAYSGEQSDGSQRVASRAGLMRCGLDTCRPLSS